MAYLTRRELLSTPVFESREMRTKAYHSKTAATVVTIFLSHSHLDADLLDAAIERLGNEGVKVYVDWKDSTMPSVTSPITANRLKAKINECEKFVLLATNNALASRWVPWELGVADMADNYLNVAIMPVTNPPHTWIGSEYVGIYQRIIVSDDGTLGVFRPNQTSGISLEQWLRAR